MSSWKHVGLRRAEGSDTGIPRSSEGLLFLRLKAVVAVRQNRWHPHPGQPRRAGSNPGCGLRLWTRLGTAALTAFFSTGGIIGAAAGALDRLLDRDLADRHGRSWRRRRWRRGPCRFVRLADEPVVQALPTRKGLPHGINGDAEQDDLEQKPHAAI